MWTAIGWCFAISAGLAVVCVGIIGIPWLVYTLPYACWIGWNAGTKGIPKNAGEMKSKNLMGMFEVFKNATLLYTGNKDKIKWQ